MERNHEEEEDNMFLETKRSFTLPKYIPTCKFCPLEGSMHEIYIYIYIERLVLASALFTLELWRRVYECGKVYIRAAFVFKGKTKEKRLEKEREREREMGLRAGQSCKVRK